MNNVEKLKAFIALSTAEREAQFLAWVATKRASETFSFTSSGNCAMAQFGKFLFPEDDVWAGTYTIFIENEEIGVVSAVILGERGIGDCKTFGEILETLKSPA